MSAAMRFLGVMSVMVASCGCSEPERTSTAPPTPSSPVSQTPPVSRTPPASQATWPWDKIDPPETCQVTRPDPGAVPPSPPINPTDRPVRWAIHWFGNESLWTRLPSTGVLPAFRDRSGLTTKFPWWRLVPGRLKIEGRTTAGTGTVVADVPSGYGDTGFVPSGLRWSQPGCWRVVAAIDDKTPLTFVVWVQEFRQ